MKIGRALWCGLAVLGLAAVTSGSAWAARPERLVDVGGTLTGTSQNSDTDTVIQRNIGWAKAKVPVPLKGGNALLLGLSYEVQHVSYQDFQEGRLDGGDYVQEDDMPEWLNSLDATLGFVWKMTDTWTSVIQFNPGLHSDFWDSNDDLVYNGSLMFMRPFGGKNRFGLGLAYSDSFGSPMAFPLLMIDWYPSERWFVEGTLPLEMDVGYRFTEALRGGLEGVLKGYMYRLDYESPWDNAVLRYREVRVGPFVDWSITNKFHMRVSAGAVLGQKAEIRDSDNNDKLVDGDYDPTAYATLNFFYAL